METERTNRRGTNQYTLDKQPKSDLRLIMEAQGHNCNTLSHASGINYTALCRIVSGDRHVSNISVKNFLAIARGLKMTPSQLVKALGL